MYKATSFGPRMASCKRLRNIYAYVRTSGRAFSLLTRRTQLHRHNHRHLACKLRLQQFPEIFAETYDGPVVIPGEPVKWPLNGCVLCAEIFEHLMLSSRCPFCSLRRASKSCDEWKRDSLDLCVQAGIAVNVDLVVCACVRVRALWPCLLRCIVDQLIIVSLFLVDIRCK